MKKTLSVLIPFAKHKQTGKYLGIDEVPSGLDCECSCIKCNMRLKARKNYSDGRADHFAHHDKAEVECDVSYWVSVRSMAEQILAESKYIDIPYLQLIFFKYTRIAINSVDRGFSKRHKFTFDLKLGTSIGEIFVYFITDERNAPDGRNTSYRNSLQEYFTDTLILEIDLREIENNHHQAKAFLKELLIDRKDTKEWVAVCESYVHSLYEDIEQIHELESSNIACDAQAEHNRIPTPLKSIHSIDPSFDHSCVIQSLGILNTDLWKEKDYKTCEKMIKFYDFMNSDYKPYHKKQDEYAIVYKGANLWFICYKKKYFYTALLGEEYFFYDVKNGCDLILLAKTWHISFIERAWEALKEKNILEKEYNDKF